MEFLKDRLFGNLATTILGLVAAAVVGIANKLQPNPNPLVYGLVPVLMAVGGYLRDPTIVKAIVAFVVASLTKKPDAPPPPPPAAPTAIFFALALGAALLAARPASAQDIPAPEPVPAASSGSKFQFGCLDVAQNFCLRPTLSFSGVGYDITNRSVLKSVVVSAPVEFTLGKRFGLLAGPGFQTGDVQAFSVSEGVSLPFNLAIMSSQALVGTKASVAVSGGYDARF